MIPSREKKFWAVDWNKLAGDWNKEVAKQFRIGGGGRILLKTATHLLDYDKQKQSDTTAFNTMATPSGFLAKPSWTSARTMRDSFRSGTAAVRPAFQAAPTAPPPTAPPDGGVRPPQSHVGGELCFVRGSHSCNAQVEGPAQRSEPAEPEYLQPVRWEQGGTQAQR